ncbi:DNA repair protein RecO [Geomobilimonas luticola]|uniref:DNA repair protein RecO n=1 Tax=Geomobilimonas luticola TaxID=1114878 RepID=A0ABS5SH35_9BACT|nr:DNA repair protein RecO [Geomobilimonas luticola]MBT0654678.1 DNA repair protein RecO [Geomobilimonas luticola]
MRTTECESIILGATDYREADRLVTFFCHEHGKLRGVARGAKRSRQRFGGALEPFARLRLQVGLKEGLVQVQGADILTVFAGIRADLARIGCAGYACELVDRLLPEGVTNPRLFRLLSAFLEFLDHSPPVGSARRFFELNLLNILGYRPALEQCAGCGADLAGLGRLGFSAAAGGLLCRNCDTGATQIAATTVSLLQRCLATGRFGAVDFPSPALAEAGKLLDACIAIHLSRPLNSLVFLRELEGEAPGGPVQIG